MRKGQSPLDLTDHNKRTRWALGVLSVLFAITLWIFVTWDGTTMGSREVRVQLKYDDLPDGYSVASQTKEIKVMVQGRYENLLFSGSAITASIGVDELKPGKYRLPVQIAAPEGVRIASYNPPTVEFELFRVIERRLRPRLVMKGDALGNYTLKESNISPAEVSVRGPEASVLSIRQAEVRASYDELRASSGRDLPVTLVGEKGDVTGLLLEPRTVRVTASLTEAQEEKSVPVRATVSGAPAGTLELSSTVVSPDRVRLRGPKSRLQHINELRLEEIDLTGIEEDMDVELPLRPPVSGVEVIGPSYAQVKVEFHSAVERHTYLNVPVTVRGKGVYQDWELAPATASVTIEWSVVPGMTIDGTNPPFELYVDITNVVSRQLTLPLLVKDLPLGIKIIRLDPEQVQAKAEVQ